jgi:imidazolonepropionase-like amidohydrolase
MAAMLAVHTVEVRAETVAIVGGTIIDGNGGALVRDGVIVIENERISAIGGRSTPIPRDARRIAAAGKYIMPGLMDANVHLVLDFVPYTLIRYEGRYDELAIEAAQIALRNGVTTVFDSWGPRQYLVKARDAINEGRVPGSRVYLAGNIVGLGGPFSEDFWGQLVDRKNIPAFENVADRLDALWEENVGPNLVMMTPEQVRKEIRDYTARGINFLKYAATTHNGRAAQYIQFSPRAQQAIVEEAHRAGITVQTHTSSVEGLRLAVEAGVDLLQHCETTGPQPIPPELLALIVERRVPCAIFPNTTKAEAWYTARAEAATFFERYKIIDTNQRALLRTGAVILLATDGGVFSENTLQWSWLRNRYPPEENLVTLGEGHFHWLRAVEQKGMKPMDALLAATRNIARAYKVDRDLGTLEKGKLADLLILDRNPLETAANYPSISLIMKAGRIIDRDALPTQSLLTAPR